MIGKKLGGRYECLDRVGGGGMAVVYKAKDLYLDRIVALKVLRPQYAVDDDFVHRFRREAQAAASLSHPHVVSIYDVGIEEDIHYIVMEYVEGSTLKEYITRYAPLPVEEAVQLTRQIAEALDHAHHNQIIHRDIKPHNILIGKNRRVKVTDFGIARAVTSSTITHTGSVIGSVHYFSPEQARGGMTGEKSDLYSLGIVLYEMLTGELPFSGESPISIALKHLQEQFTEPRVLNPSIPQSVENIIIRSLAKDPMQRYGSAKEMMRDLETCLDERRLIEQKYFLEPVDDEEATKVIPAIREDMLETKVIEPPVSEENEEDDEAEEWEEEEKGKSKKGKILLKVGLFLVIIFLLGFVTFQGIKLVSNIFYVQDIQVEEVVGLPLEEARELLEEQGLQVGNITTRTSDEYDEGIVIRQDPVAGHVVKENSYVNLTVSEGKEMVSMPSLVALPEQTAMRLLINAGFLEENVEISKENHDDVQVGHVIRQDPDIDEQVVPAETKVTLVISEGKEKFAMPELIGRSLGEAEAILKSHNLVLAKVEEEFSDKPVGEVYDQFPLRAGEDVEAGTPITIWVSKGFEEVYRERTEEVTVEMEASPQQNEDEDEEQELPPPEARITIFVTDVDGNEQVVDELISETKTYSITLKVSRDQLGTITVFKDGELYTRKEITF